MAVLNREELSKTKWPSQRAGVKWPVSAPGSSLSSICEGVCIDDSYEKRGDKGDGPHRPDPFSYFIQGLTSFFCEGPDSKYFQLCHPEAPRSGYSALLLQHESSPGQCVNAWARLCWKKTLFAQQVALLSPALLIVIIALLWNRCGYFCLSNNGDTATIYWLSLCQMLSPQMESVTELHFLVSKMPLSVRCTTDLIPDFQREVK